MECSVPDCPRKIEARGWCSRHYARWKRTGSVESGRDAIEWTTAQVTNLKRIFAAYPPPCPLPSAAELEQVLGHTMPAIKRKASKLGISGHRQTTPDCICVICHQPFRRNGVAQTACSLSCGQKLAIARHGHARGMVGKRHTQDTRERISRAGEAAWARATPEQREAMLTPMWDGWQRHPPMPSENMYSRTRGGTRDDIGLYVRSSWEANYARYLNWLQLHGEILSWEYEPRRFDFPVDRGNRSYTPDFRVVTRDGSVEWHEVKGWMDPSSRVRLSRFSRYFPDETLVLIDPPFYHSVAAKVARLIEGWE